jgi:NADPH2:quinone reductase
MKIPILKPKAGEVLIKVMAVPINPSDVFAMKGYYSKNEVWGITYPFTAGFEGSGLVIANGGGMLAKAVQGKRVAFLRKVENSVNFVGNGAFAQYITTDGASCVPLQDSIDYDVGSMSFVNPLTSLGLLDTAK